MSQNTRASVAFGSPHGSTSKVFGVGHGEHVALLDADEPVDRRAVEGHPVLERVLQLGRADGEALQVAEHVGEPQADRAARPRSSTRAQTRSPLLFEHAHRSSLVVAGRIRSTGSGRGVNELHVSAHRRHRRRVATRGDSVAMCTHLPIMISSVSCRLDDARTGLGRSRQGPTCAGPLSRLIERGRRRLPTEWSGSAADGLDDEAGDGVRIAVGVRATILGVALAVRRTCHGMRIEAPRLDTP